jgi:hypothetical protein
MLLTDMGQDHHIIALSLAHRSYPPRTKTPRGDLHHTAEKLDGPFFFPGIDEGEPHRLWPAKKMVAFFSTSLLSYPTCGSCAIREPVPGTAFMPFARQHMLACARAGTGEGRIVSLLVVMDRGGVRSPSSFLMT